MVLTPSGNSTNGGYNHRAPTTDALAYTVVWSPLPPITWFLPFIGHTGIADSRGVISDFQGPYTVGDRGHMAFGAPTRFLKFHLDDQEEESSSSETTITCSAWDQAIQEANQEYRGRMHNIFCDNCHSHVAYAMNRAAVREYGVEKWDMVKLAVLMTVRGRFLSWGALLQTYGPFCIILFLILFFSARKG